MSMALREDVGALEAQVFKVVIVLGLLWLIILVAALYWFNTGLIWLKRQLTRIYWRCRHGK